MVFHGQILSIEYILIFNMWLLCRSCYGSVNKVTDCGFSTWWRWDFSCNLWSVQNSCRVSCVKLVQRACTQEIKCPNHKADHLYASSGEINVWNYLIPFPLCRMNGGMSLLLALWVMVVLLSLTWILSSVNDIYSTAQEIHWFIEPTHSVLCCQKLATEPCPEPV